MKKRDRIFFHSVFQSASCSNGGSYSRSVVVNRYFAAGLMSVASLVGCTSEEPEPTPTKQTHQPIVAGAGYTTFDAALGGCLNGANPNGINCNAYSAKDKVYMS